MINPEWLQEQRSVHDDAEYRTNYRSNEFINALYALENGWDGAGVLVGVIDDGVVEIPELAGRISPLSKDFAPQREGGASIGDTESTHGTPVAAIIAAANDGQGVQGLAPAATIVALRTDFVTPEGAKVVGLDMDKAIIYAADNGVPILNMSLGKLDPSSPSPSLQAAVEYFADRGGLVVNSTGNSFADDPSFAIDVTPENRDGWLFVGAMSPYGSTHQLSVYSNTCGIIMDRCVMAMGDNITHDVNGQQIEFSGTSSAAPQASALAALILSKWPQLTGVDAGNVILNTARDIGDPGTDPIYGRGLIDVKAALSPVEPTLSNGAVTTSVDKSVMVLGTAFGGDTGSTQTSFKAALADVTVLDAYGRDFTGDLSGMVVRAAGNNSPLRRRLDAQANSGTAGFAMPTMSATLGWSAFETAHVDENGEHIRQNHLTNAKFAVRLNDTTVTAGFNTSDNVMDDILGLAPSSDAMFAYSPLAQTNFGVSRMVGNTRVGLSFYHGEDVDGAVAQISGKSGTIKVGMFDESGTVFGTPVGAGAMRFGDGAQTAFAEVASGFDHGNWSFDGYASLGATRLKLSDDMLLNDASLITSARFGFTASRAALGGQMSFGVAQPLVALSGNGTVTVGSGYDIATRSLTFDNRQIDLRGQVQPQVTFGFTKTGYRSSFRLGAASSLNAADVQAVGSWAARF